MATPKSLLSSAALLMYVAILNFERAGARCGGFYLSCINFKVSQDGIAAADCINSGGNYSHSTINLDSYIANYHGVLGEGQGFSETCQDISWDGYGDPTDQIFLLANCWDSIQGTRDSTRFDLTYRLANTDGRSSGLDTVPLMYVRSSRLCPSTRTLPSSAASAAL